MRWRIMGVGIVTLVAVLLRALCSVPVTYLVGNPLFGMTGAGKVSFVISPWKIFLMYPAVILCITFLGSGITALHIRKIRSNDTANIE